MSDRGYMGFVGVTTGSSSIMRIFPAWAEELGLPTRTIIGHDVSPNAPRDVYRSLVCEIRDDPRHFGALVTTHKMNVFESARDLFEKIVVAPHRLNDRAYAPSRLTTKLEVLTGIKAGETDEVVRFYDTRSLPPILRTISKTDVVSLMTVAGSVMPTDYASRFSLQELLDIVAFVKSAGSSGSESQVRLQDVFPRQ